MIDYAWLVPVIPFLSFFILILFRTKMQKTSGLVATIFSGLTLIYAIVIFGQLIKRQTYLAEWQWLTIGTVDISFGVLLNPLNGLMLLLVAFVSFLIHLYSIGYMDGDKRTSVFFAYLGLFTAAMLGLVMSPNLLQFYMFWELVGLGSFLLIGFYFYKNSAKKAAKKAFIMTRIGDMGLLIGLILLFWQTNSFRFADISEVILAGQMESGMITLIAILILIGAIGKSGQFPLHTWLPDAMEGPTPVSALIHAATMVAAGIYLIAVMYPLYMASNVALAIVASVGAFTALYAATIGLVQDDIKQVLAYSTISQLGYMLLAMGVLGYTAGIFHLFTHAFFKALLFLAAGAVIHAVHTQNIKQMGGLSKKMKVTSVTFLIGALAISGFPLLSGFFSKEEILAAVWANGQYGLFVIAILAAFLTSLYMFRLFFLVFEGESKKTIDKIQPTPITMKIPMIVLAFFAIFSGYLNTSWFETYLADWLASGATFLSTHHHETPLWLFFVTILLSVGGIVLAYFIYGKKRINQEDWKSSFPGVHTLLKNKYYIDEFYQLTFVKATNAIGTFFTYVEKYIIQLCMTFVKDVVQSLSKTGTKTQTGQTQTYGAVAFLGLVLIVAFYVLKGGY
ncbi:NADH-quinone oxidoreductase subunit L [Salirhabdus euzebyi]|uniref:NADH-quinone oxidoreductase subunit L n=1 Tax=Salirhabdus euzebyi TaxID=394506 RepID=A0A841Q6J5_9BACI|nr:NADH-quinone oxidoreductase subunit L [Salirhabdus euzebyi]MBB6453973.1 NADH-quinone oxidoreductase subunit L [Salirhabdus euzebyi]